MTTEERKVIKDLKKCDFKEMHEYFVKVSGPALYILHRNIEYWNHLKCRAIFPCTFVEYHVSEDLFRPG